MPLSAIARQAAQAQSSGEAILDLIEIDHPALAEPLRVVANHEDVTHQGKLFVGYPVESLWPDDEPGQLPQPTFRIDNVSRKITDAIAAAAGSGTRPTVTMVGVLSHAPDTIERGPVAMKLLDAEDDAGVITVRLSVFDFLSEPVPGDSFTPGKYPALSWAGG